MEVIQNKIKFVFVCYVYYEVIDCEVSNKWIELMCKYIIEFLNVGVKFIMILCGERFEDDYCGNVDECLIVVV